MQEEIYQVSYKPIEKEEYLDEAAVYDTGFVRYIADRVWDLDDDVQEEAREKFAAYLKKEGAADTENLGDCIKVTVHDPAKFLKKSHQAFRDAVEELAAKAESLEAFSDGSLFHAMDELNTAYSDRNGSYIREDDTDTYVTENEFFRELKPGDVFYLGGVVGYSS